MKRYEIGGKVFTQDELVLSQEEALADLLGPLMQGKGDITAQGLVEQLLQKKMLRKALALVLVPDGESVESRDVEGIEAHLGPHLKLSQQAEVIKDFFDCNASVVGELKALAASAKSAATVDA